MSFNFQWPTFSKEFNADAARMLDSALNRGPKPKVIADDIKVEDINMGTMPPELEILEIGELSTDRFRGIFRLTYAGDAHLILSTKVQANPLTRPSPSSSSYAFEDASSVFPSSMPSRGILFAARPLVVPMQLRLSAVRLKAIVVLVVSKQKGITLVFKNDPLESVDVSSTFDSVAVIQKYLQQEIEGQLREMFREDLPGIIHRLSQRWLSGNQEKQINNTPTRPSAPRASTGPPASLTRPSSSPNNSTSVLAAKSCSPERRRQRQRQTSTSSTLARSPPQKKPTKLPQSPGPSSPRTTHRGSMTTSMSPPSNTMKSMSAMNQSVPTQAVASYAEDASISTSSGLSRSWGSDLVEEMERYDPTYGLRPDEIRMSVHGTGFSGLARLAGRVNGGLRDLTEEAAPDGALEVDFEDTGMGELRGQGKKMSDPFATEDEYVPNDEEEDGDFSMNDDDVPDHPPSDEDEDHVDVDDEETRDTLSERYLYQSPDAIFSEMTVKDSMHRSASDFGNSPQKIAGSNRASSTASTSRLAREGSKVEYETIPAVGGGIITRPRIYHTASRVQAPEVEEQDEIVDDGFVGGSAAASSTVRGPPSSRAQTARPARSFRNEGGMLAAESDEEDDRSQVHGPPSVLGEESITTLDPEPMDPRTSAYRTQLYRHQYGRMYRAGYGCQSSLSSSFSSGEASKSGGRNDAHETSGERGWSASRSSTAPTSLHPSINDTSLSSNHETPPSSPPEPRYADRMKPSPLSLHHSSSPLRPSPHANAQSMTLGASHHFMDLVNSNHTLSPFTRTLDTRGFAVRSHPVTPSTGSGGETSSSAGGGGTRTSNHRSVSSQGPPKNRSATSDNDFERHKALPEAGSGGKRRTFRLGGEKKEEGRRPDFTPLQHTGSRAHSSASLDTRSRADSEDSRRSWNRLSSADLHPLRRQQSRNFAHSEHGMKMRAIRE